MLQNPGKLIKGLRQLQDRMDTVQRELAAAVFEGAAASGMVKVWVTGGGEIQRVVIAPTVLTEDAETVGDLVVVAAKKAHEAKEQVAKQKLAGLATGLLPLGLKIPGVG